MGSMSSSDPMLAQVWNVLVSQMGIDAARMFFEQHVIGGTAALAAMWNSPQRSYNQTGGEAAAPDTGGFACGSGAAAPSDQTSEITAADVLLSMPSTRNTTQVDMSRHLKILERKWLVTGYILRVYIAGMPPRRIPLNYRTVRIGNEGSGADIGLAMPPGVTWQARLGFSDGRFILHHEGGNVQSVVNNVPVASATLNDGDIITAGPGTLRIFRLLEPPAELVIMSGQGAGERFVIDTSVVLMGRFGKRDNDITLQDPTVSREHATIYHGEGRFWLRPDTTSSPTMVNSEPVTQARPLMDNDQVLLGEQALMFRVRGNVARPRTLHSRTATVLFSDLRGWTPLAESMPLQDLIAQMDEYFKAMGDVITVHGGTLMTYQGDAIMAVFGAPSSHKDDPWRAAASALQMQARLTQLNVEWREAGRAPLYCGIGIHTGLVMVGELGHSSRLEYSAMGDTVNLTARLEQLTRDYNCPIVLSEATYTDIKDLVEVQSLGEVTVKGRSHATRLYSLLSLKEASTG